MIDAGELDRESLGAYVRAQRQRLGLSTAAAARKAEISRGTWINLESGTRETLPHHYAAIERTLGWREGSIDAIRAGGEPQPASGEQESPPGQSDYDVLATWLRGVATNPNREPGLRAWAEAQLDQLARLREADLAAAKERGEQAS